MTTQQFIQILQWVTPVLIAGLSFFIGKVLTHSSRITATEEIIKQMAQQHVQERDDNRDFRNRIELKVDKLSNDVATLMERSNHPNR